MEDRDQFFGNVIITLEDYDGNEQRFAEVAQFGYAGEEYAIMRPMDEEGVREDEAAIFLLYPFAANCYSFEVVTDPTVVEGVLEAYSDMQFQAFGAQDDSAHD